MISDVITAVDWAVDDGGFDRDSPWLLTTLPNIRVDLDFGSFIAYCFSFRFSSEWTSRRCPQRAESKEIDTERRRPKTTNKNKRETRLTLRCCGTSFFFYFFDFFAFFFLGAFVTRKKITPTENHCVTSWLSRKHNRRRLGRLFALLWLLLLLLLLLRLLLLSRLDDPSTAIGVT